MNLNYDPTPTALLQLIATADSSLETHNLAVDYDGEVIIDPDLYYPNIPIDKYKVCTQVRDISLHNVDMVKALCRSLLTIFERDMYYIDIDHSNSMRIAA
jgi:hypothetical protein